MFLAAADQLADDADDRVRLTGPEGRHAASSRRLRPGERVDVTDGAGRVAECVVVGAGRGALELAVSTLREEDPPTPRLVVVQALPKGDRGEPAVESMTEAGVDAVVPWTASRCVTRWYGERGSKSLARWRVKAREATKQSRRAFLPDIAEPASTRTVTKLIADAAVGIVLHEGAVAGIGSLPLHFTEDSGDVVVVVGPEGGLTPEEVATFEEAGAVTARLGPTVLRTSTAGVAAAAVLFARCGRW